MTNIIQEEFHVLMGSPYEASDVKAMAQSL